MPGAEKDKISTSDDVNLTRKDSSRVKWTRFVESKTPLPTPADDRFEDKVGAFEGAGYAARDLYRPARDCKMFSKGNKRLCPVCAAAVTEMIEFYAP